MFSTVRLTRAATRAISRTASSANSSLILSVERRATWGGGGLGVIGGLSRWVGWCRWVVWGCLGCAVYKLIVGVSVHQAGGRSHSERTQTPTCRVDASPAAR